MNQQKQMVGILADVNHQGPEIKLVKCLAVHNEADWVEYNLRNNYEEFDIIRVDRIVQRMDTLQTRLLSLSETFQTLIIKLNSLPDLDSLNPLKNKSKHS
jgi:hypothetical protein